jgi:hypothetical protein
MFVPNFFEAKQGAEDDASRHNLPGRESFYDCQRKNHGEIQAPRG